MEDDDVSVPDHKLCGYLRAVLTATPSSLSQTLRINTRCHVNRPDAGFLTDAGVVLSPINGGSVERESGAERESARKKWRRFGLVQGSLSVVHQIHALVTHKCLKAEGRVLRVDRDCGDGVRVVVLVDVYLPIAVWSGWQFPRMGSVAAALFRHLRCVNRECGRFGVIIVGFTVLFCVSLCVIHWNKVAMEL